ncbi:flagellar protein, FliL [Methanobrevibacter sp.]|uniref:flagellar protein, FliL n=1 Tax=Methanobrevibacter sp. TaxID=66852 RepID=UPI0026DED1B8|nr:flagellar protein, FliL [Methanobrevibacter sp.]MDO5860218.1 flagellar protein, FliL [Methanobrevibacter sp.]
MKSFIIIVLGIIVALLIVGGAVAYSFMNELGDNMNDGNSDIIGKVKDKVSSVASSESSDSSSSSQSGDSDIVSEEVKFNAQNGEGYYREVTYKDGGFRQYDKDSGELIGSSYESDQGNLPSLE